MQIAFVIQKQKSLTQRERKLEREETISSPLSGSSDGRGGQLRLGGVQVQPSGSTRRSVHPP